MSNCNEFISGEMNITILPPISTEGVTKETIVELIDKTYNTMSNYFDQVSNLDVNPNNNINKIKES